MLNEVYQTRRKPMPIDPAEHAAHEMHRAIDTLNDRINFASLSDLRRIEQLLKPLAVKVLESQDVLSNREYQLQVRQ